MSVNHDAMIAKEKKAPAGQRRQATSDLKSEKKIGIVT